MRMYFANWFPKRESIRLSKVGILWMLKQVTPQIRRSEIMIIAIIVYVILFIAAIVASVHLPFDTMACLLRVHGDGGLDQEFRQ